MTIATAVCKKCGEEKPHTLEFFPSHGISPHTGERWLAYTCKLCKRKPERLRKPKMQKDGRKRCPVCEQWLPATTEYFHSSTKDGLQSRCKSCNVATQRAWKAQPGVQERLSVRTALDRLARPGMYKMWSRRYARSEKGRIKMKVYQQTNPQVVKASSHNHRARKAGISGVLRSTDIRALYENQAGKCFYCRQPIEFSGSGCHVDHKTPVHMKGPNIIENIVLTCPHCNYVKAGRTAEVYMTELQAKNT